MSVGKCIQKYIEKIDGMLFFNFGPRVYPLGSIVIALVSPSVRLSVRLKISQRQLISFF